MRKKHSVFDGFLPIPAGQLCRKLKSRYGARNRFQEPGMELSSPATVQRLAGRYDNPMPTWFLVSIAGLKLPTQDPSLKADIFTLHQYMHILHSSSLAIRCSYLNSYRYRKLLLLQDKSGNRRDVYKFTKQGFSCVACSIK
jgi:hypothetical protein